MTVDGFGKEANSRFLQDTFDLGVVDPLDLFVVYEVGFLAHVIMDLEAGLVETVFVF